MRAFGYALVEDERPGRFDPDAATALGVRPGPDFKRLQSGEPVERRRRTGRPRAGDGGGALGAQDRDQRRHRALRDDPGRRAPGAAARPRRELRRRGDRARRGDRPLDRRARPRELAAEAGVDMLALVHISSRYDVRAVLGEAREEFGEAIAPRDFDLVEIPFPERGTPRLIENGARAPARGGRGAAGVTLDERLARHLHVESLRHRDLHPEHEPHVLFQASTIGALLEGAFDGDVTFDELAEHGDLGLGTLNGLDGEMIALDGGFYRADVDGYREPIAPEARTPFAALAWFEPSFETELDGPMSYADLLADARPGRRRPRGELRAANRRRVRAHPRPLGAAPAAAVPAADRGGRRPARVRARRGRGDGGRLPLPRLRARARGRGLSPALHQRRPRARRARAGLPAARGHRSDRPLRRAARRAAARGRARLGSNSTTRPRRRWRAAEGER